MNRLLLLPLIFLMSCVPPTRGWVIELSGVVAGSDGGVLEGVAVEMLDVDGSLISLSTTNTDGVWRMPIMVEEGQEELPWQLHLQARKLGYNVSDLFWHFSWLDDSWLAVPLSFGPGQIVAVGEQTLPSILMFEKGAGVGTGVLKSAITGNPRAGVDIELRRGSGAPLSENVVAIYTSGNDGSFAFDGIDSGIYTATAHSQGDLGLSSFPVRIEAGGGDEQVALVTPQLLDGELLAAVTWSGEVDLDLHLSGPLANYHGRYQVYSGDDVHPVRGDPVAEMLINSEGLESAIVYDTIDGEYRSSAFDVTNSASSDSAAMSKSEVVLYLWTSDSSRYETIGLGESGISWMGLIYDWDKGILHRPQRFSSEVDPAEVDEF